MTNDEPLVTTDEDPNAGEVPTEVHGQAAIAEFDSSAATEFWLQENRILSGMYQKFMDLYIKCFLLYLGFLGFMLKFAFDTSATSELRKVLGYYGILGCVLLYFLILGAELTVRGMRNRYDAAICYLKVPTYNYFWPTHWFSAGYAVFNTCAIVFIVFMLMA